MLRKLVQGIEKALHGTPTDEDLQRQREEIAQLKQRERDLDAAIQKTKEQIAESDRRRAELHRERAELLGRDRLKAVK